MRWPFFFSFFGGQHVFGIFGPNVDPGQHRLHGPFSYNILGGGNVWHSMARLGPAIHFWPTVGHGWNPKTVALWILWAGKIRVGSWSWICCSAF